MYTSARADITTDALGNATVFMEQGRNRPCNGFILLIKYTPGTIDALANLVISGESSMIPIMTKVDAGGSVAFYYPRAPVNAVADGAAASSGSELIPIKEERIKVVVSEGGAGRQGSIEATFLVNSPY